MKIKARIHSALLVLGLTLAGISCKPSPAPLKPSSTQSILRGSLLAHDGSRLKMGHVTFQETPHAIREDGSFEVALPRHQWVDVLFTGVDHKAQSVRIVTEDPEIKLHLKLGTHPRTDSPKDLKLVLGTQNITTGKYIAYEIYDLQPTADQRFETTIPILDGIIYYQISRAMQDKRRTVNGTLSTGFEYDGAGDYMSQLEVRAPEQRIVWDPKLLPPSGQRSSLRFEPAQSLAAQSAELYTQWREFEKVRFKKNNSATMSPAAWRTKLQDRLAQTRDPAVRHALVMAYFALPLLPTELSHPETQKWLKLARETLPVRSPLWNLFPASLGTIAQSDPYTFYERIIAGTADVELAGDLTYRLLQYAKLQKDTEKQKHYLKTIEDRYLGTKAGETFVRFKSRYLPPHPLRVGEPIPAFNLPLYPQNSVKLTPASFLGSYWLLDGWATWCDPCVLEMPKLHELHQEFAPKGLKVLSVAVDQKEAVFIEHLKTWPMPWKHATVAGDDAKAFLQLFAPTGLPTYILVGPKGQILAIKNSLEAGSLRKRLRQELK